MYLLRGLLAGLGLALPALHAQALPLPDAPLLHNYAIDHWTTRAGLPHNAIRAIAQTPDKHLWFATWEGLVSYNGLEFTVYDRSSQPALLDDGIGALYVDAHGTLWLSDSRGNISSRDPQGHWRFWPSPVHSAQILVQSLQMDRQGRLWLLFEGNGLGYLSPDGKLHYRSPAPGSALAAVYSHMVITPAGRIWIGSYSGLIYRDPDGSSHRLSGNLALEHGLVWPYLAPDGQLWAVSGNRIYRLQHGQPVLAYTLTGLGQITAMLQDSHGNLWVGSENQGLLRIRQGVVQTLPTDAGLGEGRVVSLHEDAEGSIWVGTNGGLFRLRHTLFSNLTQRDGLSNNYVRALLEDHLGRLWIGSAGGLDMSDGKSRIQPVNLPTASGKPPEVYSLAEDQQGTIWAGTYHSGVYAVRSDGRVTLYDDSDGVPAGNIRSIVVGSDDRVWLATQRGLVWIRHGVVGHPDQPGLPQGLITALALGPDGLWLGSLNGAWWWHHGVVTHIDLNPLGGGRTVFGFVHTDPDTTWISSDRGLYRYRGGQLSRVGLEQGLPVDAVFEWVRDHQGNVWINTNRGVLRTNLAALNQAADYGRPIHPIRYDEMDGMNSSQGNGSSNPDIILRHDGSVALATAGGVAWVDPSRLQAYAAMPPPPVVIENIAINGQVREAPPEGRVLQLPAQRQLTVNYVGLSYLLSERIEYRTRLDGLDKHWVNRGHQHSVEYIGLAPGDYVLHVSAAHPYGAWSKHEALLRFTVLPLWWQRTSVRLLFGLLLVISGLLIYYIRVNGYRRTNARLAELVDQRTRDLQSQTAQLLAANREKSRLLEQLRAQAESFERQAREDVLTGLPNRRAFDEVLQRDILRSKRHGHPLCLIMLDVDHFKRVNDQYSHQVGDCVLREVGRLLRDSCRASDLAARLGGEEFAIILANTTIEDARYVLERLRQAFHGQHNWAGMEGLSITFSAGLTQFNQLQPSAESMLRRADLGLYQAKRNGRDRFCEV